MNFLIPWRISMFFIWFYNSCDWFYKNCSLTELLSIKHLAYKFKINFSYECQFQFFSVSAITSIFPWSSIFPCRYDNICIQSGLLSSNSRPPITIPVAVYFLFFILLSKRQQCRPLTLVLGLDLIPIPPSPGRSPVPGLSTRLEIVPERSVRLA